MKILFYFQIQESKSKNKHHKKNMKNLNSICGNGIILALYHLYIMYKVSIDFLKSYNSYLLNYSCNSCIWESGQSLVEAKTVFLDKELTINFDNTFPMQQNY